MAVQTKNPIEKVKEAASSEPAKKVEQEANRFSSLLLSLTTMAQ